ncbi:hypothetical protein ABE10_00690 [Bacillus toyonensis]|nr:hypothetical protein [Bacillus toyonensis]
MEELDGDRDGVQRVEREQPVRDLARDHLPLVHDRRGPDGDHHDDLDEALRVAEGHVDRAEEHPQPGGEQRDDDEAEEQGRDVQDPGSPAEEQRDREHDDDLRDRVDRRDQHAGDREHLSREVDLLDEGRVVHQ